MLMMWLKIGPNSDSIGSAAKGPQRSQIANLTESFGGLHVDATSLPRVKDA